MAEKAGVTADTLRYYERLGVLPRAKRTSGGLRLYDDDALRQVRFVQQASALGLMLKDIRQLVSDQKRGGRDRCRRVRDLLAVRLKDVDTRLAQLRAFRQTLQMHLDACDASLSREGDGCPVLSELTR